MVWTLGVLINVLFWNFANVALVVDAINTPLGYGYHHHHHPNHPPSDGETEEYLKYDGDDGILRLRKRNPGSSSSGGRSSGRKGRWSSLLSMDPSRVLSLLVNHGSSWIVNDPVMVENLEILFNVCHAEEVDWNPVERNLVIRNFSVNLPEGTDEKKKNGAGAGVVSTANDDDDHDALHIGRVFVQWDSYLQPCVDIEVDNVTITVDFVDVLMSETNWYVPLRMHARGLGFGPFPVHS